MLCEHLSTEYLITNEDSLDWEAISSNKSIILSNLDIKLFGKNINWKTYLINHSNHITTDILESANKYFTLDIYKYLSSFGIATEEFILNHREKFDFRDIIENCAMSEDGLIDTQDMWMKIPGIKRIFKNAKKIDMKKCPSISLMLSVI